MAVLTGLFGYLTPQFLQGLTDKGMSKEEIVAIIEECMKGR